MNEQKLDLKWIVMKLVGSIEPTSNQITNQESLENIKDILDMIDKLLVDLSLIELRYRDDAFSSRKDISKYINQSLRETSMWLSEIYGEDV